MEEMTLAELLKAYSEVGIMVICALMFILLAISVFRRNDKQHSTESGRVDKKDEMLMGMLSELMKTTQQQNNDLIDVIKNNNKKVIDQIVDQVSTHTISPEESAKQSEIDGQIKEIIHDIRLETACRRASLIKYHNGGRGINGQPFLKMSMTHEDITSDTKSLMSDFKDQFRNTLGYFVTSVDKENTCYIAHRINIKDRDTSMYQFMELRDIDSLYGISIRDTNNYPIGFVYLEFGTGSNVDTDRINESLKNHIKQITELMNKKVHENL